MPPKPEQPEQVRLDSLAPQQLVELRTTLNNEIQRLGEGGATLMRAATTFSSSKKAVEQLAASKTGVSHSSPHSWLTARATAKPATPYACSIRSTVSDRRSTPWSLVQTINRVPWPSCLARCRPSHYAAAHQLPVRVWGGVRGGEGAGGHRYRLLRGGRRRELHVSRHGMRGGAKASPSCHGAGGAKASPSAIVCGRPARLG